MCSLLLQKLHVPLYTAMRTRLQLPVLCKKSLFLLA